MWIRKGIQVVLKLSAITFPIDLSNPLFRGDEC